MGSLDSQSARILVASSHGGRERSEPPNFPCRGTQLLPQPNPRFAAVLVVDHAKDRSPEMRNVVEQPTHQRLASLHEFSNSPPTPKEADHIDGDHATHAQSDGERDEWNEDDAHAGLGIRTRRECQRGVDCSACA